MSTGTMPRRPRSVSFSAEPVRTRYPSTLHKTTTATSSSSSSTTTSPSKRPRPTPSPAHAKMSLARTYLLAHSARGKLGKEAGRADHNLRRLVGHANMLDAIMLDLAEAEREEERWFNHTVHGAAMASDDARPVWRPETVVEEPEDDWDADDDDDDAAAPPASSDDESDYDDDDFIVEAQATLLKRAPSTNVTVTVTPLTSEDDDEDEEDDDDDDDDEDELEDEDAELPHLALVRTPSHSPPELLHDSDEDSDDDMPPSPPQPVLHDFSDDERKAISTTSFYNLHPFSSSSSSSPSSASASSSSTSTSSADTRTAAPSLFDEHYYLPQPATAAVEA